MAEVALADRTNSRSRPNSAPARAVRRAVRASPQGDPAGLTHDSRTLSPYPIYAARGQGPRKWDVDGNEYVDYFGGDGALMSATAIRRWWTKSPPRRRSRPTSAPRTKAKSYGGIGQPADPVRPACRRSTASGTEASHLALPACPRPRRQAESDPVVGSFPRLARRRGGRRHVALRRRRAGRHQPGPGRADDHAAGRRPRLGSRTC